MEIARMMEERGFEFLRPIAWLNDPRSGDMLQMDTPASFSTFSRVSGPDVKVWEMEWRMRDEGIACVDAIRSVLGSESDRCR